MPELSTADRHKRIRFVKRLLRYLPRRTNVHRYPVLKWFGEAARRRAYLWSFRVSAMTPAFYVGSLLCLQPIIGVQIPLAFLASIALRANLPTMVGLQLLTNIVTATPVFAVTYQVGAAFRRIFDLQDPETTAARMAGNWVIGGIISGLVLGCVLDLVYRFLAYEARKHKWHLPRRKPVEPKESASPAEPPGHKD